MKVVLCISAIVLGVLFYAAWAEEKPVSDPREHWAFKPPVRPQIPRINDPDTAVRNPIDAFIFAEQEKRGLKSAPEARKEILLRRVYLDLTGLPPTREKLHDFLADPSPNAYDLVVDRLLASPQYAERWARHWMDIWRYADWYGRRHVPDVWNSAPQVWRWREWIVRSLNADKGYDRMLTEMLAADETTPEDDNTRVATGYLVRNWYALNPNQWMRDVVEHTGKAFLALTFNCAHCHDHKYDPITQRDYFQFRAFFEPLQVRQDWVKGEPDPGPFQKYEYSALRKLATNGIVSVFDEKLDAKTFIYLRGDERNLPEGEPTVEPAMPAFLRGDSVKPQRCDLPTTTYYPGLKPFIQEAEIRKREQALASAKQAQSIAEKAVADAKNKLAKAESTNNPAARALAFTEALASETMLANKSKQLAVAQAECDAIHARIAADRFRCLQTTASHDLKQKVGDGGKAADELASAAGRAEKLVSLHRAEAKLTEAEGSLALLQAEQSLAFARRSIEGTAEKKEEKEKSQAALKKAQEQIAAAEKSRHAAETALMTNHFVYTPLTPIYPTQSSGRRSALASWIASRENPLTARVAVNHIWGRHFHTPLLATVFDFGRNGARPTHPELLDWLAVEFMEHGWSMKHLHRLIVTSSAYRRASSVPASERQSLQAERDVAVARFRSDAPTLQRSNAAADSENRFLWRMNSGQMEAEAVRDSILHLADELDLTPVGYPLQNSAAETSHRRSLYFECFPEPGGQSQFAEFFDPAEPLECYRRTKTIVPQQALALTNSKLSVERSRALAQRLTENLARDAKNNESTFIIAAFEQILTRGPSRDELVACREFLVKQSSATNPDSARASLIQALFNHNDFLTIR